MVRSFEEVRKRIRKKEAVILTADEVSRLLEEDDEKTLKEVDVVTTGTRGIMSGTYALLSFPTKAPRVYTRAESVLMNGIRAHVGPSPNERLGVLEMMIFGTSRSEVRPMYGAGHLFRELSEGKKAVVEVRTEDGVEFCQEVSLEEMPLARLMATRNSFRNYRAFVNSSLEEMESIFHAVPFPPGLRDLTLSGAGHLSPLENDPALEYVGVGTRVLINGADGFVTGTGTRSSSRDPNLMMVADMKGMNPDYMGGFKTPAGPECIVTWGVPIAMVHQSIHQAVKKRDREVPMPVADVTNRATLEIADYGQAWEGVDLAVRVSKRDCGDCLGCDADEKCPTDAISFKDGRAHIDRGLCYNCGLCSQICPELFLANLGKVRLPERGIEVPIRCRQTDRLRSLKIAKELKERILEGSFQLTQAVESLRS